jgi:collagen type VII alpha
MPTARPFAYNPGAGIPGTTQVGNLAIGTPEVGFVATGLEWWNGPDEDLGYVIACEVPGDTQPTPIPGVSASVGFFRSSDLTEGSFIAMANKLADPLGGGPFASGSAANTWLNANGFWSSFVGGTGSTGATGFTVTLVESGANVVMTASGSLNINDLTLVASSTGPFGSGGIGVNSATWLISSGGQSAAQYTGFSSTPSNFGSGSGGPASSITGDIIGVVYNGAPPYILTVPVGYTTGTQLTASQTFANQTFASMGLVQGTYTYAWGSGANADLINVIVGGTGATGSTGGTGGTGGTGDFNVTVTQVGPDVVWSGSGSFNLSSLTLSGTQNIGSGLNAGSAIWAIGPLTTVRQYTGSMTFPSTFGTSGSYPPPSDSGSTFGIIGGGPSRTLLVPDGYTSGSTISGTVTYANTTIAGMGLNSGTYVWSWGSGGSASTVVMTIS